MTNDEARIIIERALHIPVAEADAAWILACIEERLRNDAAVQAGKCPTCAGSGSYDTMETIEKCPACKGTGKRR